MCKEKGINFETAWRVSKEELNSNDFPKKRNFKAVSELVDCGFCGGHGYLVTDSCEIGIKQETCKNCGGVGKVEKVTFEEIVSKPAVRIYDLSESDLIDITEKLLQIEYEELGEKTVYHIDDIEIEHFEGYFEISILNDCFNYDILIEFEYKTDEKTGIINDFYAKTPNRKIGILSIVRLLQEKGVKFNI